MDASAAQRPRIRTKLLVPQILRTLVARPRLIEQLNTGHERKLTLVSAPAGFGKTTLVAHWLHHQAAKPLSHHPALTANLGVAWVSLAEGDNHPQQFWGYLLEALETSQPGLGTPYLALFQLPELPPIERLLTALINTLIAQDQPMLLVLDDYHLIENQTIHLALSFLIEHLPPCLHVVLITRTDPPLPLARLRAQGDLLELRTNDLRCTTDEIRIFLTNVLQLQLSDDALATVATRTEGWLAGLQLFGLWLQGQSNPNSLVSTLSGTQMHIMDYLAEQVWERLPKDVQIFLLRTSILERLTAALCDTVASQPRSQARLEHLERANLFLLALDSERRWYRYHHLFAEVLRARLARELCDELPTLHRRASHWYAAHGYTNEAIEHALRAEDWDLAGSLIETVPYVFAWNETHHEQHHQWLQCLPEAIIRRQIGLSLRYAKALYALNPAEVEPWLTHVESLLATADKAPHGGALPAPMRDNMRGEIAAYRAHMNFVHGDGRSIVALCQQALDLLSPENQAVRAHVAWNLAIVFANLGASALAERYAREASLQAYASGNRWAALLYINPAVCGLMFQGRLRAAYQLIQEAIQWSNDPSGATVPVVCWVLGPEADILYEWNQLDAAATQNVLARELALQTKLPTTFAFMGQTTLAQIEWAHGNIEAAYAALHELERAAPYGENIRAVFTLIPQVQIWLRSDDVDRAVRWAATREQQPQQLSPLASERQALACVLVLVAQQHWAAALTQLEPLFVSARTQGRWDHVIEILLIQALIYAQLPNQHQALQLVAKATRLAAPQGYIRRFIDHGAPMYVLLSQLRHQRQQAPYLDQLLAAFPAEQQRKTTRPSTIRPAAMSFMAFSQPLVEPLSTRELEVLNLIAQGASNRAIAANLAIAPNTVKHHISNILGKLDVTNRTQAMERARTLGLLNHCERAIGENNHARP